MNIFETLPSTLSSPEGFLSLCDEPNVFGAKKKAQDAYSLWESADDRIFAQRHAFRAPGGMGSGLVISAFWDPSKVNPDLAAIAEAINSAVPVKMIKEDEKSTWKGRNKKQNTFFVWRGIQPQPLSQWFLERFGVHAYAAQLINESDLAQNAVVIAVKDGVDNLWPLTLK
ncbi:hypothetical protein [Arthrobacter sp. GMC3]|uniref:hypothetical protein n=1 Tax=Arthrobacter sp. GMC3 TaxID=2058894 RepID=UPI000CE39D1D|nr:hypothetical protein [Arthrobacter sp. GMC3]